MNMEDLLEEMEEIMENGTSLAFTSKLMVDGEALRHCLEDMRLNIPEEIRQARAIAAERTEILENAKRDAKKIIAKAEERASMLVSTDVITQTAQQQANELLAQTKADAKEILFHAQQSAKETVDQANASAEETLAQAKKWSTDMRAAASTFVEDIIRKTDDVLSVNLTELRQVRKNLHAAAKSVEAPHN